MLKKDKNQGFSMIELLAVVVILGILSTVTIVSVRYLREKAKTNHYHSLSTNLISATQNFVNDNPSQLPRSIGQGSKIQLKALITNKYIKELKDFNKELCDPEQSFVDVYKYAKDKYSYKVTLFCPNYNSTKQPKYSEGPKITIVPDGNIQVSGQVSLKIEPIEPGPPSDKNKILSYKYVVSYEDEFGNYIEKFNSGDVDAGLVDEVIKIVELDVSAPINNYTITVTAVDIYGNLSVESNNTITIDNIPPSCPEGSVKSAKNAKSIAYINSIPSTEASRIELSPSTDGWINTDRSITIHCSDCVENGQVITIDETEKITTIELSDNAGNKQTCYVPVYVDKNPPEILEIENSYGTQWAGTKDLNSKDYKLTIDAKDDLSGIESYSYNYPNSLDSSERVKKIYSGSKGKETFTTTKFTKERNENVEIEVCDSAGNCSSRLEPIKIDKTAPTLSISNPYLGVWPSKADVDAGNYKLTLNSSEYGSGIAGYSYQYSGTSKKDYSDSEGKSTFITTPFKQERIENVIIEVCDNVDNCSSNTSLIKIDTTPPTAPSVIATYNYDATKAEGSKAVVYDPGDELVSTGKVFLADRRRSTVSGPSSTDSGSGVKVIQVSKDKTTWVTYNFSETNDLYYAIGDGNHKRYFRAVDYANNVSTINNFSISIDSASGLKCPTYSVVKKGTSTKVGKETWINSALTVNYNFSASTATNYKWYTRTGEEGEWTQYADKPVPAGKTIAPDFNGDGIRQGKLEITDGTNTKVCETNYYYVDKTAPTCSISLAGTKGSNDWYKSNVTVTLSRSDTTSGVNDYGLATTTSTYNKKYSATQGDTSSITYYGVVKDKAGNVTTCSKKFKVDKTKPTCSLKVSSGTKGSNSWYTSDVTVSLTKSGATSYGMATSNSATYNSTTSLKRTSDTSGLTYYGFVKDDAGNTNTCSLTVKVDKTNPPCTLEVKSGTKGDNGWYTSELTFGFKSLSGVSSYGIAKSNSPVYSNNYKEYTIKSDMNKVYYGFTKAASGRVSSCSIRIKKDATPPTGTISLSNGTYAKGKTTTLTCSDALSGLYSLQISYGSKKKTEKSKSSLSLSLASSGKHTFTCKDKAGNKKSTTRTYTVTSGCPEGDTIFGTQKGSISGNWQNKKVYANEYFSDTWCQDSGTSCWANYGYPRVSVASSYYKGKTAKEITELTGCYYAPYWCSCYNSNF